MYQSILIDIIVPYNNISINIVEEIRSKMLESDKNSDIYTDDNNINISLYEVNKKKASYLEGYLDTLSHNNKEIRYSMKLFEQSKKYPHSIRINKKGKKIFTKQQTKFIVL